jgi:hypothetical protein
MVEARPVLRMASEAFHVRWYPRCTWHLYQNTKACGLLHGVVLMARVGSSNILRVVVAQLWRLYGDRARKCEDRKDHQTSVKH